jgi:hypothetical protein
MIAPNRPSLAMILLTLCALASGLHAGAQNSDPASDLVSLQRAFEHPPEDCKIMMRWWWFGPSVTRAELQREMRVMKEGGIGGFEVQPVYPLALDDIDRGFRNYPFLSDEFIEMLRFASSKARELGLRMDLTLGSGWPYGGPSVPVTQAAGKLRFEAVAVSSGADRVPLPYVSTAEKLIAAFLAKGDPKHFESARELSDIRDGAVRLPSDLEGPHVVLFFISSRTGQTVKRAALGAEGFVLDHYDGAAVQSYLKSVGDRLMQAFGPNPPRAVFCDSLEVYGSDWTGDFLEEFRRRRGYSLEPYLPALVSNIGEKSGAIRHDWGQTLTELLNERFVAPVEEWARAHRTLFRAQLYGVPPAILSTSGLVDLPEGERGEARWRGFAPTRWASSASHLYGRPVTSSETWTWLHSPAFRATPLDLKAEADIHFLEGTNQLVGHGWPYSPPEAGEPGWRFYAAAALDQHNPWWLVMADIALYLQRVSFMLRQGAPANDVAIYLPTDDAWARFSLGNATVSEAMDGLLGPHLIARLLEAGHGFDSIDDAAINRLGKVEKGALAVNANRYPIVILPGVERMPVVTLQKLEGFARQGGILISTRRTPSLAPGLMGQGTETGRVRELSQRLFEGSNAPGYFAKDDNLELGQLLRRLAAPDVTLLPAAAEVGFVHRRSAFADVYFLANSGNQARSVQATFRVEKMAAEWWDPFTGKVYPASVLARPPGGTAVALDLEPYGSRILVFSKRSPSSQAVARAPRAVPPPPLDLSTGWKVSFAGTGRSVFMDRLRSWADDEGTRFFSGEATYERTATVPQSLIRRGLEVRLDFGEGTPVPQILLDHPGMQAWLDSPIREAAVVFVNERRAGSVWHPPYSVEVTGFLHSGENTLRVVVGNLAINGMAGSALPDYRLLNSRYGVRFTPQDMSNLQALPSGLLGTVRLVARQTQPTLGEQ